MQIDYAKNPHYNPETGAFDIEYYMKHSETQAPKSDAPKQDSEFHFQPTTGMGNESVTSEPVKPIQAHTGTISKKNKGK